MIAHGSKVLKKTRDYVLYQSSELYKTEEETYVTHLLQMSGGREPDATAFDFLTKNPCSHGPTCRQCEIGGVDRLIELDAFKNRWLLLCHYSRRRK